MKALFITTLCLAILLCGCYTTTPLPTDQLPTINHTITEPTASTAAVYEAFDGSLIAISTPIITENVLADDGSVLFTHSSQDITLTMDDPVVAEAIMSDFINRNSLSASSQSIIDSAKDAYSGQADWKPYSCSIVYNPVRLDQGIISFYGNEIIDNGSPRSTSTNVSVTYDMISGTALSLSDILVPGYSAEQLVDKILSALEPMSQQGILFADYEYIVSDQFSTNVPTDKWYFSNAGLCFYFTAYEIAPYNVGTVVTAIPYGDLVGLLKDTYFPAEQVNYNGKLSVVDAESNDLNSYERITEVIVQSGGNEYLIVPQGTALNVQIQYNTPDNSEISYSIYSANALTEGDAVLLQFNENEKDNITISYNDIVNQKLFP